MVKKAQKRDFTLLKKVLARGTLLTVFVVLLLAFISYSRGYRFNFSDRSIVPTGLMAVSSSPKAAKIYVNGTLKGVTDTNLISGPGTYTVEVKKEGYTSYKKDFTLRGEIVETVDAILFPVNPSLAPLTNLGITRAQAIENTDRVLLFIENAGETVKDGIYLFEANRGPISFFPPLKPLLLMEKLPTGLDVKSARVSFSPKLDQAIIEFPSSTTPGTSDPQGISPTTPTPAVIYLMSLTDEDQTPADITTTAQVIQEAWIKEKQEQYNKILETFPKAFARLAYDNIRIISFSPSETKLLYQAKRDEDLPLIIHPALIGSNQHPEARRLTRGAFYVYDRKEDKNYRVDFDEKAFAAFEDKGKQKQLDGVIAQSLKEEAELQASAGSRPSVNSALRLDYVQFSNNSPVQWYPNSRNLVIHDEVVEGEESRRRFMVVDYDGSNRQTVYSGPYESNFYIATGDGKLVVLANLNPQANKLPDLYVVGIR